MADINTASVSDGLRAPQVAGIRSIPITIERQRGSIKRGVSPNGKPYVCVYGYKDDGSRVPGFVGYGYIPRTMSGDGENLDVYLGDDMTADMAYVVHQGEPDPELKLMLGWPSAQAAHDCYVAHTPAHMMLGITPVPVELLLALLNATPVEKSGGRFVERMMKAVHGTRLRKALECAQAYRQSGASAPGNAPIPMPADFHHDALTLPLTGTYPEPELVGGWLGWIEPATDRGWGPCPPVGGLIGERGPLARDWIAFVATDGHALLWQDRDDKGGVCGTPLSFQRPDLVPAPPSPPPKCCVLPREACGYFVSADDVGTEPTSNACPLCGEVWTHDNVRTHSLLELEPTRGDVCVFYRTHRTCALACEAMIEGLDEQALSYARGGALVKTACSFGKWVRKSVDGKQPVKKPFTGFPSFDACTSRMRATGHDAASAARICGAIEARVKKAGVSTAELLLQAGPPDEWSGGVAGVLGDRKQDVIALWNALSEEQRTEVRRVWNSFFDAETSLLDTADTLMEAQPDLANSANPDDPHHDVRIINKAADDEMRYVLGVVLEPLDPMRGEADTQGDSYTAEAIRKAQWGYMMHFCGNVSYQHKGFLNGRVYVVDCYTAPIDMLIAGSQVRAGTWLAGFYIPDDEVWGLVKSGELNALSIGGVGKRTPITR